MASKIVRGDVVGGFAALVAAFNSLKSQIMGSSPITFKGSATLVAGTVTVSNVWLGSGSTIALSIATPGGTPGDLEAPTASRTSGAGTGSFVINSSSGADTSTVNWEINYIPVHQDAFENVPATWAASATDLPTSIALLKQLMVVHAGMIGDTLSHAAADTTNTLANTVASVVDLASSITAANDLKAKFNAHLTQSNVHTANDTVNTIATANATDLPSLQALVNATKTAVVAHIGHTAPSMAASLRLVNP